MLSPSFQVDSRYPISDVLDTEYMAIPDRGVPRLVSTDLRFQRLLQSRQLPVLRAPTVSPYEQLLILLVQLIL